ncbi:MAG: SDR family NAD(P)-dependent oxidoreductase [Spirochaetales bacterium]|nr:SDR family NAD(P)-dependent oxidoreductase [Spirochaetales bacterium]
MKRNRLMEKYGNWALITGASAGIGKAFACILSSLGINTMLLSDDGPALKETALFLEKKYAIKTIILNIDLSSADYMKEIQKAAETVKPGIIINNAGYGLMGYFLQHTFDEYKHMLSVDEEAVLHLTYHFCRQFYIENRRAAIINVSSANAEFYRGIPFSAVYSASKSFIKNISEAIYHEMKPFGIDVLNVAPGPTKTSFQEKANTNTLSFAESPENVVRRSLSSLGKKPSVTTNRKTLLILAIYHLLPLPASWKTRFRAWIFRTRLGKKNNINLDAVRKQG